MVLFPDYIYRVSCAGDCRPSMLSGSRLSQTELLRNVNVNILCRGLPFFLPHVQDIVLGVLVGVNINHEFCYLAIFAVSGFYNVWFCYDLFNRLELKFLWPRLILSFLSVFILNKFVFDYLSVLGLYITR